MRAKADVVIVGGGCMGASVAFHLSERGITNVVLVERETQLGTMSTGRNAGGFRHQFSNAANIELSKESISMLADFEHRVGAPIDFWPDGYLFLLSSDASVTAFRRNVELQRKHGIDVEWLTPQEAAARAPGISVDGVIAATFCARDGIADPNGVTMGFARAAQQRGVEIVRGTEVTGVALENGRVREVHTTAGPIQTRTVVNAAGPWASEIGRLVGVNVPVVPERRHIFIAQPPGGGTWDLSTVASASVDLSTVASASVDLSTVASAKVDDAPHRGRVPASRVMVIDFESTFYFHREGGGLLFGMGDPDEKPGFDTTVRWDFLPHVIEVAVHRLPALADAAVSHAWAGLYEMTPDHNPIIGPSTEVEGFYTIAGFSGHGFQHSPAAGRILADLIAGRDPRMDVSPFAPARFARTSPTGEQTVV